MEFTSLSTSHRLMQPISATGTPGLVVTRPMYWNTIVSATQTCFYSCVVCYFKTSISKHVVANNSITSI